ncbi:MAG: hypothetical protein ACJAUP_002103 [Cellvibrionaceae bacterium]|jgi:hypothetical protein
MLLDFIPAINTLNHIYQKLKNYFIDKKNASSFWKTCSKNNVTAAYYTGKMGIVYFQNFWRQEIKATTSTYGMEKITYGKLDNY